MQVRLNPVWLCRVVTSDRHAEGETPNKPTETHTHHKKTLQFSPYFLSSKTPANPDVASYFQKEVTFTNERLYFLLLDSVVVRDPNTIKVESP